jgi:hypothetical protein
MISSVYWLEGWMIFSDHWIEDNDFQCPLDRRLDDFQCPLDRRLNDLQCLLDRRLNDFSSVYWIEI